MRREVISTQADVMCKKTPAQHERAARCDDNFENSLALEQLANMLCYAVNGTLFFLGISLFKPSLLALPTFCLCSICHTHTHTHTHS